MSARIVFVSHTAQLYGAPRSLLLLLERLDRARFEPTVVCPYEGPLVDALRGIDVPVVLGLEPAERQEHERQGALMGALRFGPTYLRRVSSLLRDTSPDLVYLNSIGIATPALLAWCARVPVTVHVREARSYFEGVRNRVRRYPLLKLPRRWVAVSGAIRDILIENGVPAERVTVIHNGVDPSEFAVDDAARTRIRAELGVAPDQVLVGLVGAVEPRKGVMEFVEAAAGVAARCPDARFVVVGGVKDAEYGAAVDARVVELGIAERLQRTGYRSDVASVFGALDVVANPTREEPFARVNVEAMAASRPIVATDVDGNPEAIADGETGLLVPLDDAAALAAALARLVDDADLRERFGAAARRRAEQQFTADRYADQVQAVLADELTT